MLIKSAKLLATMKPQMFVVHGGNAYDSYEEYLQQLKAKTVDLKDLRAVDWKMTLQQQLQDTFEVYAPAMPNKQNAKYIEWKIWFEKYIPFMQPDIVFIGHSLGAIFLAKYLSENIFPLPIRATFLVGAPFNTATNHPLADFNLGTDLSLLTKQAGTLSLYHSTDDEIVPYKNLQDYQRALPDARVFSFVDRGHFRGEHFPEILEAVRCMK